MLEEKDNKLSQSELISEEKVIVNTIEKKWKRRQKRLFTMVSVGVVDDPINQSYDVISIAMLLINLTSTIMNTFDKYHEAFGTVFYWVEQITVGFFALDYILRLLTAPCLYPDRKNYKAVGRYMVSFFGVVDLLSFLPVYLPIFFPTGAAAFRMFRVVRILRLFRINSYYDSLNVITEVLTSKKTQLMSSAFIIGVLMIASSLIMYSVEHEAQPDVFKNAFSGIWWSTSTLLTVGYGDIYPVTEMGKALGILISFLGVGMVAIPTGIISAGFVEQYTRLKMMGINSAEEALRYVELILTSKDEWVGKQIKDLHLPQGMLIAMIKRRSEMIIPRGDVVLKPEDVLIVSAQKLKVDVPVYIKEVILGEGHSWNNQAIQDLDISRQSFIVMVERKGKNLIPNGKLVLKTGDKLVMFNKVQES